MREIKFRGLRTDGKGWVKGYLSRIEDVTTWVIVDWDNKTFYHVIPESVGQFTGLHDKHRKEIYEGDVLGDWENVDGKMMQSRQTVFWHDDEAQYMLDCSFNQDRTSFFSLAFELKSFEYEIIGNVHEHTHLIN